MNDVDQYIRYLRMASSEYLSMASVAYQARDEKRAAYYDGQSRAFDAAHDTFLVLLKLTETTDEQAIPEGEPQIETRPRRDQ